MGDENRPILTSFPFYSENIFITYLESPERSDLPLKCNFVKLELGVGSSLPLFERVEFIKSIQNQIPHSSKYAVQERRLLVLALYI